ncbi:MAG: SUMF1/EgtB/PvdO family nonheme iron enzyme [Prevotellaceae bacterium]|jgi:hypothetical protein|nr:SUMF1/EgtB/PvdO family nonheme iron enzyme [Prevotellaceae bacterium]
MKKTAFLLAALACTVATLGQGKKSVAVVPATGESVSRDIRTGISNGLEEGIFSSGQYTLVARGVAFDKALSELKFQQNSGAVSDNQFIQFGHATGADFVCYATVSKYSDREYRISYKMIDIALAEVVGMGSETVREGVSGLLSATDNIAAKLFGGKSSRSSSSGNSGNSSGGGKRNGDSYNPDGVELVYVEGTGGALGVQGFYIGKYEVTQAQWQKVMGSNPSDNKSPNNPVGSVSWNDAQEFLRKLNALTGRAYRLPSEDEWVYAANGGLKNDAYEYAGSNSIGDVAWYDGNSGDHSHAVGGKSPNAIGIHDMSGNVWEWCQDCYDSSCSDRVRRGGSWRYNAFCRVAYRGGFSLAYRDMGFRVVLP